jgi:hypothetical protein
VSEADDKDIYENCYFQFIEAVRVLAASPEEACEMLRGYNVAFETKYDVDAGPYLFNYAECPLSSQSRAAIAELVEALKSIPEDLQAFTDVPAISLDRMRNPLWIPLRKKANDLLELLKPMTDLNEQHFRPDGK